jgi:hypothetical protein
MLPLLLLHDEAKPSSGFAIQDRRGTHFTQGYLKTMQQNAKDRRHCSVFSHTIQNEFQFIRFVSDFFVRGMVDAPSRTSSFHFSPSAKLESYLATDSSTPPHKHLAFEQPEPFTPTSQSPTSHSLMKLFGAAASAVSPITPARTKAREDFMLPASLAELQVQVCLNTS